MSKISKVLSASKAILESMPQFAYVFNKQNELLMWNKHLEIALGYTKEELYKKDVYEFMEESTVDENTEAIHNIFSSKEEQSLEQNILTKSGKKIPVIDTANYAFIDGEEYLIGMAVDISKLRKTQKELETQIIKTNQLKQLLETENINLRKEIRNSHEFSDFVGKSKILLNTLYQLKQVAKTNSTVLIQGEIGTRKEFYARALYNQSNRKDKSFIKISCNSYKSESVEKDFYAFLKSKFTEVDKTEIGKYKTISISTLFFEEINLFPIEFQSKLLNSLKNGRFEFIGNPGVIHLDARVIASCSDNLEELVKKNLFSKDLFFYLNTFPIAIPPLRERISDIPILVDNFITQFNQKFGKQISKVPKKNIELLQNYSWPGNVKELENVIERAVILSTTSLLKIEPFVKKEQNKIKKILTLNDFEREYIIKILNMTYWRVAGKDGAAKILGLHPETLRSKMRKLQISKHDNMKYNVFH